MQTNYFVSKYLCVIHVIHYIHTYIHIYNVSHFIVLRMSDQVSYKKSNRIINHIDTALTVMEVREKISRLRCMLTKKACMYVSMYMSVYGIYVCSEWMLVPFACGMHEWISILRASG